MSTAHESFHLNTVRNERCTIVTKSFATLMNYRLNKFRSPNELDNAKAKARLKKKDNLNTHNFKSSIDRNKNIYVGSLFKRLINYAYKNHIFILYIYIC